MPFVLGINHATAPIDIREKLSVSDARAAEQLHFLKERAGLDEIVLLSTCNRTEAYARAESPERALEAVAGVWSQITGVRTLQEYLYIHQGEDAVHHLFRVAAGLDSMVKGENEILAQVKQAYTLSHQAGYTGKLMNVLFQRSLFVGKRVRTETAIAAGQASVGSVAVSMADRIFGSLKDRTVMLLGAGETAETIARHLLSQKIQTLMVCNRTFERARELAHKCGGIALAFEEGLDRLALADIVLCATAAPHHVVTASHVERAMHQRRGRSLFFIDIAVPRDVEPAVHDMDNVYVYDIDDLQKIIDDNLAKRSGEAIRAEAIVQEETSEFVRWLLAHRSGLAIGLKHLRS